MEDENQTTNQPTTEPTNVPTIKTKQQTPHGRTHPAGLDLVVGDGVDGLDVPPAVGGEVEEGRARVGARDAEGRDAGAQLELHPRRQEVVGRGVLEGAVFGWLVVGVRVM